MSLPVRYLVLYSLAFVMRVASLSAQPACDATAPATTPVCSRTTTATAVVPQILRMELSTMTTAMAAPDVAQYDSTRVATSLDQLPLTTGPLVTIKANRAWSLKIEPAKATFDFTPEAGVALKRASVKPAADLAWSIAPSSGFVALSSTSPADVSSNMTGGSFNQFTMYYRTKWQYSTDAPGTYALSISYTLTGQ
jgi:hypothetical protein